MKTILMAMVLTVLFMSSPQAATIESESHYPITVVIFEKSCADQTKSYIGIHNLSLSDEFMKDRVVINQN